MGFVPRPGAELQLPPLQSNSFIILKKITVRRPGWTAIWKTAWQFPSAVSAPIRSTTTNLYACRTIRFAAPQAGAVLLAELLCAEGYIDQK